MIPSKIKVAEGLNPIFSCSCGFFFPRFCLEVIHLEVNIFTLTSQDFHQSTARFRTFPFRWKLEVGTAPLSGSGWKTGNRQDVQGGEDFFGGRSSGKVEQYFKKLPEK